MLERSRACATCARLSQFFGQGSSSLRLGLYVVVSLSVALAVYMGFFLGLKRMFEGSIPSLAGANSNGEKLERTFIKHSKKIEVPISTSRYRSMQHLARSAGCSR